MFNKIKARIKQAKIAAVIVGVLFLLTIISNIYLQYRVCVMTDEIAEIREARQ